MAARESDDRPAETRLKPLLFLAKLLPLFFLTYYLWRLVEPSYIQVLAAATRVGVWLSELSTDPLWHAGTTILTRDTAIWFTHRNFAAFTPPLPPQGIPAEWVMANLVLLIPLMLATPAPTWRARFLRFGLALLIALLLQVVDVILAIKVFYANTFRGSWGPLSRSTYQFLDAFFQSFDTQLFPFAIWAGIHFRPLLALSRGARGFEPKPAPRGPARGDRAQRRRAETRRRRR